MGSEGRPPRFGPRCRSGRVYQVGGLAIEVPGIGSGSYEDGTEQGVQIEPFPGFLTAR